MGFHFSFQVEPNVTLELEKLANNIVAKCQGLPLAIVALGGLLSAKSSETEWRRVSNSVSWELHNNPMLGPVKTILLLNYNGLPYRLKRCFLYCCLFPEDYEIKRKRLVRLWMAEGFVEHVRGITPDDVAQEYFLELIRRSMLQVVERNSMGLPKACKMHDLLRELALSILEEEKFCSVYDKQRVGSREEGMARRLSIQGSEKENKLSGPQCSLKNLQVLGCIESNTVLIKQVRGMSQLVRLELFNITKSDEVDLCSAIQNMSLLYNLLVMGKNHEVLRLDALKSSPPNLRTLILIGMLEKIPEWFQTLQNLRDLSLHWSSLERNPASDLAALPNLRKLYISKVYNGNKLDFLEGFNSLETLYISNFPELETITIAEGVMPSLKFLRIGYCDKLTRIPWGIEYLTNLQELELINIPRPVIEGIRVPLGINRTSVQHISRIINFFSTSSGWYWESLS